MNGFLTGFDGSVWALPPLLRWEAEHGLGSPCDAFSVSFLYESDFLEMLDAATRFRAEHEGETVFSGVVDEYEIRVGQKGAVVTVRGRGLAALLLDNEAEAAEYYNPGTAFILQNHVYPWGITEVRTGAEIRTGLLSVSGGSSQWRVVEDFFRFCGGIQPRFSKERILLLDGSGGRDLLLDGSAAITEQVYTGTRCGVISEVLVKMRNGAQSLVENEEFKARGGNCRRVVYVPRKVGFDGMRHTGAYQIQRSEEDRRLCRITLPQLFAAFPGDRVTMTESPAGLHGRFTVCGSRSWANAETAGTVLDMRQEE